MTVGLHEPPKMGQIVYETGEVNDVRETINRHHTEVYT